jgi:hypothetical protein
MIEITPADLEAIRAALHSAYMQNVVLDMADEYRKLNNRSKSSPMTKALEHASELAADYLNEFHSGDDAEGEQVGNE